MAQKYDVIIIGAGPAGIFTAIETARKNPRAKILIMDKGRTLERRSCPAVAKGQCVNCDPCGITSGWAGAGAFSDGKLSLAPEVGGRLTDYMPREKVQDLINYADSIYLEFGARPTVYGLDEKRVDDIMYEASKHSIQLIPCPVRHLGTELALEVLKAMYDYLMRETNTVFMELTNALDIVVEEGRVKGVLYQNRDQEPQLAEANFVVAAPGRGGANWLAQQTKRLNIPTENNEVDIGVRVEVPNSVMDHLTRDLYEAKLVYYSDTFDNRVRSFCVNPGGVVSEEHYDGQIAVVNGHSYGG